MASTEEEEDMVVEQEVEQEEIHKIKINNVWHNVAQMELIQWYQTKEK